MASLNIHFMVGLLILSLLFNGNSSEYKQWKPDTNWNNPKNWKTGKVPCSRQDVQLISLQPLVVAISGQMSLRSLSLPMNGELIMNKDAELAFHENDKATDQCPDTGDVAFTATMPKNWYNPDNWREVDTEGNPARQYNGLLHLNQIPCKHDQVQFKKGSSFLVKSDQQITVASLIINGEVYSQKTFQDYLSSSTGSMQFNLASIKLTGDTCSDPKGCFCDTFQVNKTVCSFVECEVPQCKKPLTPNGSCCSYCGVILKIKPLSEFNLSQFKQQINSLSDKISQGRTSQVQFSISRTQDGLVQAVFADFVDGKKAESFAGKVIDEISASSQLTIQEKLQSSTPSPQSDRPSKGLSSSKVGMSVGIGVGLAVLILIVIVVVLVFKRKRPRTASVVESGAPYEQVEMQAKNASTEQLHEQAGNDKDNDQTLEAHNALYESTHDKQAFDNPLYESTGQASESHV